MVAGLLLGILGISTLFVLFGTKTGKRLRLRVSGTADEIIEKDASTPDGAKAYYNAIISKKEEDCRNAYDVYKEMLGKIKSYEEQLRVLKKESMQVEININNCIDKNDDEGARVYLKRQQEISDKEEIIKNTLKELKENSVLQKENVDTIFEEVNNLKSEKETSILTLEAAQTVNSLQATPCTSDREEDKMLEKVRDGIRKTKEKADGNKIAYENSVMVQQQRLDKRMKDDEVDRKLQELKTKRGK